MSKDEIEEKLYDILKKFPCVSDLETLWDMGRELPFTGRLWNFDAIEMTYLFFEVEKEFAIHIRPHFLEKYRFNSVNGIINTIVGTLDNK